MFSSTYLSSLKDARDRTIFTLAGRSLILFIFYILHPKEEKMPPTDLYTVLFTQPLISMKVCSSLKKLTYWILMLLVDRFWQLLICIIIDHYGTVTAHSKFPSIFFSEFSTSGIMMNGYYLVVFLKNYLSSWNNIF